VVHNKGVGGQTWLVPNKANLWHLGGKVGGGHTPWHTKGQGEVGSPKAQVGFELDLIREWLK